MTKDARLWAGIVLIAIGGYMTYYYSQPANAAKSTNTTRTLAGVLLGAGGAFLVTIIA